MNDKVIRDDVHPNKTTGLIFKVNEEAAAWCVITNCFLDPYILDLSILSGDLNLLE